MMRRLSERWNEFFFAPTAPEPMAAFRILFGIYLCWYFVVLAPHVTLLFSNEGVYVPYLVPDYAPGPAVAWVLYAMTLMLCVCFTLGYRSAWVTPLLLGAYLYHYFLQLAIKHSSFERLMIIYLAVLCLSEANRVWALDARGRSALNVAVWPERVLRFQTSIFYFGSGLWKLTNRSWRTGKLLWATFQGMWATPLGLWLAGQDLSETFWNVLTWSVIISEMLLGVAFTFRRSWPLAILVATSFHLLNVVVLYVPEFLVSIAPLALFVQPQTLRRLAGWLSKLTARISPRADAS